MTPTTPPSSSSKFTSEQVESYRVLAERLLRDRFANNQTALARELDIHNTNIRRFVVLKKGGLSSRTAERICQLAGVPFPFDSKKHKSAVKPTSPPPPVKKSLATSADEELEKTLDYFHDRWPVEVQTLARMLVAHRGLRLSRDDWQEKLDEIESCIGNLVASITK